jgi:hypothetical protein
MDGARSFRVRPRYFTTLCPAGQWKTYPDAPNQRYFSSGRLDPGEKYKNTIVLRFSTYATGRRCDEEAIWQENRKARHRGAYAPANGSTILRTPT